LPFQQIGYFSRNETEIAMPPAEPAAAGYQVTLTRFHNNTGEFLDLALREKVKLTKHGRAQWHIIEASYLDRIEAIAAGNLLEALQRRHSHARDLDKETRARMAAHMPTNEEIANDRWNDQ
jgi:hypothetical protein